jgi:hypothetical protein
MDDSLEGQDLNFQTREEDCLLTLFLYFALYLFSSVFVAEEEVDFLFGWIPNEATRPSLSL